MNCDPFRLSGFFPGDSSSGACRFLIFGDGGEEMTSAMGGGAFICVRAATCDPNRNTRAKCRSPVNCECGVIGWSGGCGGAWTCRVHWESAYQDASWMPGAKCCILRHQLHLKFISSSTFPVHITIINIAQMDDNDFEDLFGEVELLQDSSQRSLIYPYADDNLADTEDTSISTAHADIPRRRDGIISEAADGDTYLLGSLCKPLQSNTDANVPTTTNARLDKAYPK